MHFPHGVPLGWVLPTYPPHPSLSCTPSIPSLHFCLSNPTWDAIKAIHSPLYFVNTARLWAPLLCSDSMESLRTGWRLPPGSGPLTCFVLCSPGLNVFEMHPQHLQIRRCHTKSGLGTSFEKLEDFAHTGSVCPQAQAVKFRWSTFCLDWHSAPPPYYPGRIHFSHQPTANSHSNTKCTYV